MRHWFFLSLACILFLNSPAVFSQEKDKVETEVGIGETPATQITDSKYIEVEGQFRRGLPNLLEQIKNTASLIKKRQLEESMVPLKKAMAELQTEEAVLGKESQYKEIGLHIDKIENALGKAESAIERNQRGVALNQLAEAYKWTKALSESPVLPLAGAEIALGQASRQIMVKNYQSAGLFLQRAIDFITKCQQDPRLDTKELNRVKNEIIITQQQVVLGKLQDEKRIKRWVPGLAAARVNSLNTYYDIWNRSEMPWDLY